MKNNILFFLLLSTLISCHTKKDEFELKIEINESLKKEIITKEYYLETTYPLIKEIIKIDSNKYSVIDNIAEKANKEKNEEIFKSNILDLKNELNYLNK